MSETMKPRQEQREGEKNQEDEYREALGELGALLEELQYMIKDKVPRDSQERQDLSRRINEKNWEIYNKFPELHPMPGHR